MKFNNIQYDNSFIIDNISFVTVQRNKGFKMSFSEGRKQHAFIYTVSGFMNYSFFSPQFQDIKASSGELVFIPEGTSYISQYMQDATRVKIAQFDIVRGTLPEYLRFPTLIETNNTYEIFSSLSSDLKIGTNNSLYFLYRIYELLWNISIQMSKIPYKYKKIQKAIQELTSHYYENRKISDYADMSNMSEPGFRRLFTEYIGCSPIKYRNLIRLQEAKKLLRSGEYSVEETAAAVGFTNLSFFCRAYKQYYGHSPGKES